MTPSTRRMSTCSHKIQSQPVPFHGPSFARRRTAVSISENFSDLGRIAWLWMNSNLHDAWSTRLMMQNVIPPITLGQYRIISDGAFPVAYASWAFFSPEAEQRYIVSPSQIDIKDWSSGDRMWFIDYISPFSPKHTLRLKSELRDLFSNRYARALRVRPDGVEGRVLTYSGEDAPDGWRDRADAEILSHFAERRSASL